MRINLARLICVRAADRSVGDILAALGNTFHRANPWGHPVKFDWWPPQDEEEVTIVLWAEEECTQGQLDAVMASLREFCYNAVDFGHAKSANYYPAEDVSAAAA